MPQAYAKVDKKQIDGFVTGLRYTSSIPFVRKAFGLERIKDRLLRYIRETFPLGKEDERRRGRHLVSGWRTYDIPASGDKVGFVLQHRDARNLRTKTILRSLEEGSRGYYVYPKSRWWEGDITGSHPEKRTGRLVGKVSFTPGDGRGNRHHHNESPGSDFAVVSRLHIPARPGRHYVEKAYDFAKAMILEAKPEFFRQVKEEIKKGRK